MDEIKQLRTWVSSTLESYPSESLQYNEDEFWMIRSLYEYIEYYAHTRSLRNTLLALPLARGLHNGTYRKFTMTRDGSAHRIPYVMHCLRVCTILMHMNIPLSWEDQDILLASALCHDMIEDIPFEQKGLELIHIYHLDPRVYETVLLVSKRNDFTPEEQAAHVQGIQSHPLALLVKLADRSHNVEDLYNRSPRKVREYIGETRDMFLPMCSYGFDHYPHLVKSIEILQDKINCLTRVSEILMERCETREQQLKTRLQTLEEENTSLRSVYQSLWNH
ncbi:MAG: HD domain-containing protein [Lachnospiraceae bacterium]|nr:HD domain-containing protein [Lachnospiraceae bacterium]